jgi:hypothetical protein
MNNSTIAPAICVPIISASGSSGQCYCRWCQLIGALAFDETRPPPVLGQRLVSALAATAAAPQAELFRHPQGDTWSAVVVPQFHNRSIDLGSRAASRALRVHGTFGGDAMARIYNDQLHKCRSFTSSVRGIDFAFWTGSADFDTVWRTLMFISLQPWVAEAYVGVTRCCRWRWADCAENESMSPHRDRFQMMYPVCASYGESICALERLLQAKLVVSCPTVCAHGPSYRRGLVKARDATILYFCTRVIS